MKQMRYAEPTAAKRRVFFHLVDATDLSTPETGEAGGQPQVSINGAAFADSGIGVLVAIGNGRYYAELGQATIAQPGWQVETRYKSANTAEAVGDSVQVVAFDPNRIADLGASNLDAKVSDVLAAVNNLDVPSAVDNAFIVDALQE